MIVEVPRLAVRSMVIRGSGRVIAPIRHVLESSVRESDVSLPSSLFGRVHASLEFGLADDSASEPS